MAKRASRKPAHRSGADICREVINETLHPMDRAGLQIEALIDIYEDALMGGDPENEDRQCRLMLEFASVALGKKARIPSEYKTVSQTGCAALQMIEVIAAQQGWQSLRREIERTWNTPARQLGKVPDRLREVLENELN